MMMVIKKIMMKMILGGGEENKACQNYSDQGRKGLE
jgi:hypothetical protein